MITTKPSAPLAFWFLLFIPSLEIQAQVSTPPVGGSQKSSVCQWMGIVQVCVTYSSPDGRELLQKKKTDEALKVLKQNAAKHPDHWVTQLELARAYGAQGDYKTALKYANTAKKMIPKKEQEVRHGAIYYLIDQLEKKEVRVIYLGQGFLQAY